MLNSGKKIDILTLVLSEKKILNETKKHNPPPPFKLNGRSLTVLSCFGKLFRSVMNNILKTVSDEFLLLNENPIGFRKKYTMLDNICVIYMTALSY